MAIFGADQNPTFLQRLREGAGWLIALVFAVGVVWLTAWLDDMGEPPMDLAVWGLPFYAFVLFAACQPRVIAWRGETVEADA